MVCAVFIKFPIFRRIIFLRTGGLCHEVNKKKISQMNSMRRLDILSAKWMTFNFNAIHIYLQLNTRFDYNETSLSRSQSVCIGASNIWLVESCHNPFVMEMPRVRNIAVFERDTCN